MNNENNEGIIIEGGVTEITFNEHGFFPIIKPIEEVKIQGGIVRREGNKYCIPTMKGLWIMVGNSGDMQHAPRIKVSNRNVNFKNHSMYNSYSYDNGELQVIRGSNSGVTKKDDKRIEEFFLRNVDDIILNSNSTKLNERIDDLELYDRIAKREIAFYEEGGR